MPATGDRRLNRRFRHPVCVHFFFCATVVPGTCVFVRCVCRRVFVSSTSAPCRGDAVCIRAGRQRRKDENDQDVQLGAVGKAAVNRTTTVGYAELVACLMDMNQTSGCVYVCTCCC